MNMSFRLVPAVVMGISCLCTPVFAQEDTRFCVATQVDGIEMPLKKDTLAQIAFLSAKCTGGKTYLKWNVINLKQGGVFVIYASCDGKSFESIGSKEAVGVPINKPIAYYFIDDSGNTKEKKYYKVIYINRDCRYLMSESIKRAEEALAEE